MSQERDKSQRNMAQRNTQTMRLMKALRNSPIVILRLKYEFGGCTMQYGS